jgi:hypothetical protein
MAPERIKRLKDLIDAVERLPASPERERLLSEVRSRAVDLDTGVTPRAMLPVREPATMPAATRPPKARAVAPPPRPRTPSPTPSAAPLASTPNLDWDRVINGTALLSLDEAPECWPSLHDAKTPRPWTLGLRG